MIETAKQPIDQRMEYYMQNLKSVLHADAAVFQGFDPDLMAREFRPTSQDRAKKYVQYVSAKKSYQGLVRERVDSIPANIDTKTGEIAPQTTRRQGLLENLLGSWRQRQSSAE